MSEQSAQGEITNSGAVVQLMVVAAVIGIITTLFNYFMQRSKPILVFLHNRRIRALYSNQNIPYKFIYRLGTEVSPSGF